MNERIRHIVEFLYVWLILIPAFWLVIWFSAVLEKVKEVYYRLFSIPFYKGQGKFHFYVKRTDR